jgi:hypothetical protein
MQDNNGNRREIFDDNIFVIVNKTVLFMYPILSTTDIIPGAT